MATKKVRLERSATGRLRDTYPVNAHDIEVRITTQLSAAELAAVLGAAVRDALGTDPRCRRVLFAAPADDPDTIAVAKIAGLRHVVDVDIPGAELSLLVAEPHWVTTMELDQVPGS